MFLLVCGKTGSGKRIVSSELIKYFGYRGVACYEYDYQSPLDDIEEAAGVILSRYLTPEEIEDNTSEPLSMHLRIWASDVLFLLATRQIKQVTARWDDVKLHYIAIVRGMDPRETYDFSPAFKVLLTCTDKVRETRLQARGEDPSRGGHLDLGLDDYAVSDIFDLVVDTSVLGPDEVAALIGESLHDKMMSPFKGSDCTNAAEITEKTDNGSPT